MSLSAWSVIGEEDHIIAAMITEEIFMEFVLYLEVPENNKESEPENSLYMITHVG